MNIITDTATLAEAMYPGGGLDVFNIGVYEGTRIPIRKLTGREVVTVIGTTAGAKILANETWIADRFGDLGAKQIKKLERAHLVMRSGHSVKTTPGKGERP